MAVQTIPAFIALLFKLGLLAYALHWARRDATTRLFVVLLVLFSLHNLVEFFGLNHFAVHGLDRLMQWYGYSYFAIGIPFIAVTLHLSLRLSVDNWDKVRGLVPMLYAPVPVLEFLLLGTDKLVQGFQLYQSYTILRVPGPLYFLFETYAPVYLFASLAYVAYGARGSRRSRINCIRNRWWLVGLLPFVLLNAYLIIANHFGLAKVSSTVSIPIALTLFLIVTTYATHQYRLFDIEFFFPWSKIRKRKTEFYKRIQATIAEMAELRSVRQVLDLIASTLHCQVALIGGPRPLVALAPGQDTGTRDRLALSQFPREALANLDQIVIANEAADRLPELYGLMKRHKVGAIVPFNAHGGTAGHWMLLGEHFSDSVYTPLDFKRVEVLFNRIAERFLDDLLLLRSQLVDAKDEIRDYQRRLAIAWDELTDLRRKVTQSEAEKRRLREDNARLRRGQLRLVPASAAQAAPKGGKTLEQRLAEYEAALLAAALREAAGDRKKAARMLRISPRTLQYLIERHHLDPDERVE